MIKRDTKSYMKILFCSMSSGLFFSASPLWTFISYGSKYHKVSKIELLISWTSLLTVLSAMAGFAVLNYVFYRFILSWRTKNVSQEKSAACEKLIDGNIILQVLTYFLFGVDTFLFAINGKNVILLQITWVLLLCLCCFRLFYVLSRLLRCFNKKRAVMALVLLPDLWFAVYLIILDFSYFAL